MKNISVIIPTLNEESNLQDCIQSVAKSNDIVVYDSYSDDNTVLLAEQLGARVIRKKWIHEASHKNWALKNIEYDNDWVFHIDADERMVPELWAELVLIANSNDNSNVAYYCSVNNYFQGRSIARCYPPVPILRFYKPSYIRYERAINPRTFVNGSSGLLKGRLKHYSFNKGLHHWIGKHNNYSTEEAREAERERQGEHLELSLVFSRDPSERRRTLKRVAWRLPFRPLLRFLYSYVFRMGFLDGRPGFRYCVLISFYEYLINLKMIERRLEKLTEFD